MNFSTSFFVFPKKESFSLQRTETIDNSSGTGQEYFTFVQGGTEISNSIIAIGGEYDISINFLCLNTSTSGSVVMEPILNGTPIFAQPYEVEPKDNDNVYYVGIKKRITLLAGANIIELEQSNVGAGTGRIFEANVIIKQV